MGGIQSGLLSSLKKEANKAAASLSREADHIGRDIGHAFDSTASSPILVRMTADHQQFLICCVKSSCSSSPSLTVLHLAQCSNFQDMFANMNEVQLVSRNSGKTLQIVVSPTGVLVVDGQGAEGPAVENGKLYCPVMIVDNNDI